MAIVMEAWSYEPLNPGRDLLAELRYGSNGNVWGAPEIDAGSAASGNLKTGRVVWDKNPSDGVDSGWVPVTLVVRTGEDSMIYWSVDGQEVMYLGPSCSNITEVQILTGVVDAQASIEWSSLSLSFFYEGAVVDQWSTENGPSLDRTEVTRWGMLENLLTIQSQSSYVDEVQLTGLVRITAPRGSYLDANSVFSQILIKDDAVA